VVAGGVRQLWSLLARRTTALTQEELQEVPRDLKDVMILVGVVSVLFSATETRDRKRKHVLELLISFALPPLLVAVGCGERRTSFFPYPHRKPIFAPGFKVVSSTIAISVSFAPLGLPGGQLLSEALCSSMCLAVAWPRRGDQGSPASPGACSCAGHATTPG